jgi:hypothetical protein
MINEKPWAKMLMTCHRYGKWGKTWPLTWAKARLVWAKAEPDYSTKATEQEMFEAIKTAKRFWNLGRSEKGLYPVDLI